MQKRTERYELPNEQEDIKSSRVNKNKVLYDELGRKIETQVFIDFDKTAKIDLNNIDFQTKSRDDYRQLKGFKNVITLPMEEKIVQEVIEDKESEIKNFDINAVLEEARANRTEIDELEKRRKLKDTEYTNMLSNLNKKYLSNKEFKDEGELQELIDTITSKTLVKEDKTDNDKELLSELFATSAKVDSDTAKDILNEPNKDDGVKLEKDPDLVSSQDNTFYTKSMELDKHDFEFSKDTSSKWLIPLIVIIIFTIILVVGYFVLSHFGVNIGI